MAVNRARNSWDKGYQQARILEREIGNKLFEYSKLSTVNTSEHDEENPNRVQELGKQIEEALSKLSDNMDIMGAQERCVSDAEMAKLQRFREMYFDFNKEYKGYLMRNTSARDRLFQGFSNMDNETDVLLREKNAVDQSRSLTDSIIGQAMAAKSSLERQRQTFSSSHGKVTGISNSFKGINSLVDQIKKKKLRNNTILAGVIAMLICFTLWWMVLSKT